MSANNNATSATIGGKVDKDNINLLDKLFEIPPYQRLYEWESMQIEELLNDIKKAFDKSKENYFIGNITISTDKNDNNKFELIDGQQRLTTLWFIGFYLASNEKCGDWQKKWQEFIIQGNKLRIAMPIRDNEENALKELAKKIIDGKYKFKQDKDNKIATFQESSNIHQKIIEAFSCIESWFVNGNGKNIDLANFAKYIYENVCFVFVTLAQNTDLNRFFVRMNNRGKQLEKHEILKARMLGAIQKSGGEWQKYAKIWNLCSDMDKYIFQSASDRDILNSNDENSEKWNIDKIISESTDNTNAKSKNANNDSLSKVESIIDFSTFLLHCLKLQDGSISIAKDKLLDIFDINDEQKWNSESCKKFIESMLLYRVLFDYFVIKNDTNIKQGNAFRIRRLESYKSRQNTYYRLPDDSKSVSDNSPFKTLATLQNYLRVARQGEKQNYHHWLTPFLKFLYKHIRLDMNLTLDETKEFNFENFEDNAKKIANQFSNINKCEGREKVLINFLENLDTKLATHQLGENNEKSLLDATNSVLKDLKVDLDNDEKKLAKKFSNLENWDFLNHGTGTPHYWFYRLEYYLWNGIKNDDNPKIGGKNFSDICKNFYFRNLNSVEHIHPQSVDDWGNDNGVKEIDKFGNLALLSVGFNSSLNDNAGQEKYTKLLAKVQKDEVESLKLWLVYAKHYDKNKESWDWDKDKAKKHQESMIDILKESLV